MTDFSVFTNLPDLYRRPGQLIAGRWRPGTSTVSGEILDPASGRLLTTYAAPSPADLDEALASAERGSAVWRRTPAFERARVLRETARLLRERASLIAALAAFEQGKPLAEGKGEVGSTAEMFEWCAEEARRVYGRSVPARGGRLRQRVEHQPIGVVAAFAAWNFPIRNPGYKLAAALAAGCACIIKPAEETPLSCIAIAEALRDAGLPPDVLNVVYGDAPALSQHLIRSPVVRKVSFTGSTRVGTLLAGLAAEGAKPATLELGGHAPVLVFEDADIELAARLTCATKFRNAGQMCISPSRFFVHASRVDAFVEQFVAVARQLHVGSGFDPATTMGPMSQLRRIEQMERLVGDARERGAQVTLGGSRDNSEGNKDGWFWEPTVVRDVPQDALLMSEEPFGPVAAIASFDRYEDVIAAANRLPYGLAAYAFTRSLRIAEDLGDEIECGMLAINTTKTSWAETPFGGVKESGFGSEGGVEALEAYLVTKSISLAY
jgi:succinate-semialdehyde dehydrogenase/glutarate-semialdehyde dehydrogenase